MGAGEGRDGEEPFSVLLGKGREQQQGVGLGSGHGPHWDTVRSGMLAPCPGRAWAMPFSIFVLAHSSAVHIT